MSYARFKSNKAKVAAGLRPVRFMTDGAMHVLTDPATEKFSEIELVNDAAPVPAPVPTPVPTPAPVPPAGGIVVQIGGWNAVLGAARGGEVFIPADGNHGHLRIDNRAFPSTVTILGGEFQSILFANTCKNITIKDARVYEGVLAYNGSTNLTMDGLDIGVKGRENYRGWTREQWLTIAAGGIDLNEGPHVIRNCKLMGVKRGVIIGRGVLENNRVAGCAGDGKWAGNDSRVEGNITYDYVQIDGNHGDSFQAGPCKNLTLKNNVTVEWVGDRTGHPAGDAGLTAGPLASICQLQTDGLFDGMYENVTITGEMSAASQVNGITIMGGINVLIENNTMVAIGDYTAGVLKPGINVSPHKNGTPSSNVRVRNNRAMQYSLSSGIVENTGNTVITAAQREAVVAEVMARL